MGIDGEVLGHIAPFVQEKIAEKPPLNKEQMVADRTLFDKKLALLKFPSFCF